MAQRILVTGISGFVAKHIALQLLQKGYEVRGTVRSMKKSDQVRQTLAGAGADVSGLSFTEADLTRDDGWDDAAEGCAGVMHVASPFPIAQPRDRNALTPAARDGALRVLRASRNAERIVMTSSMAAMMYRPNRPSVMPVSEGDWTDVNWNALSAYVISKTEAEKSAWEAATEDGFKHRLTTINPGFILGPALDDDLGASLEVIRMFLTGAYPAVPPVSYPVVDVRDVAELHIRVFETPETGGRRIIASADTISLKEMAAILHEAIPERSQKIPKNELPAILVRLAAVFDRNLASVIPDLGTTPQANTSYVSAMTGMEFRTAREATVAAARSLEKIKAL
jgi:nucleoside-diphosphate-sugar epimerase